MSALLERALVGVRTLEPYQPGKPIEELERELGISDIIKLASNENPLGASPRVRPAIEAALKDVGLYPDGNGVRLKQKLARLHAIDAARIVLGNGSNDVLELVARTFLGPGRIALFSEFAFAVYPLASQATGAELRIAPAQPMASSQPLGHDLNALAAALRPDVGVVFIANPNNPTGTWLEPGALEGFVSRVSPQTVVVLDEAYTEYMDPGTRPDSRAWLEQYPNLVLTRTFSKVYGLAALRIGYALASTEIADLLNRVRQPFNVNSLALAAAETALDDQTHVTRSVALNTQGLHQLQQGLRALGLKTLPSQANFITVDMRRPGVPLFQALLRKGVIVRPLASYKMPDFLRITVGTEAQNTRCLSALAEVLK
ncbi:MAG: histidinol-phosphate transaminase [Nevskiales bacterium]